MQKTLNIEILDEREVHHDPHFIEATIMCSDIGDIFMLGELKGYEDMAKIAVEQIKDLSDKIEALNNKLKTLQ